VEVLPDVHAVRLIGAQAYLLVGDEVTLVDAGHAGSGRMLRRYLARIGLREVIANFSPGPIVALLTRAPAHARPIVDGEELPVSGGLRVIHTPGHTPGSVCLFSPAGRFVIVGDLLQRVQGKVTLPNYFFTDDMALARRSIARLADLDVETILFSHYPPYREGAREALRALVS